ncbi:hypothetical protein BDN72DRAFT_125657 [Pluteus cervinus]|uniref:Uncharacterized protein n=1 Tax=Pluteus cervinus TaxID=181527 RepID=A0ACD3ANZ4_9AGAR|nr:hypothetical protein BDN72DRAFT_125657 [Pluteus cervinus]
MWLSQPTQPAAPPSAVRTTFRPATLSNSRSQRDTTSFSVEEKAPPISALPFSTLSITDLVEVTTLKKPIVRYGFMPVPPSAYADMKNFNVLRAALMRTSRIEAKKCAQLKKLDGFLRLPLEIIFAVFEYVHPIDMYHLSHSSLIFRDLLKDQIPLLKRIYQSHGVPLWPPKIPYNEWSNLLFGDSICDVSTLRNSSDLGLHKRVSTIRRQTWKNGSGR